MTERLETAIVGDIVAADFRAAAVFERLGIDFCCGGRESLGDACRAARVEPQAAVAALRALARTDRSAEDEVTTWTVERLIDHIITRHHEYVRSALPMITRYLETLEDVHRARHPELVRVRRAFDEMRAELEQHLMKEEQLLFPYVAQLARTEAAGAAMPASPFGTVQNPIRMMEREHADAAGELRLIRELTGGYQAPADGCTTYAVCMAELARFEHDLHQHVHLENNILFPKAIDLEQRLCDSGQGWRQ